ncbi:MAG: carboxypeptidase regulatory-like domain-containing protein [Candidatus Electryonea clarkiae]|nr:carboxypeptidase regulatory-like domain-containing protein [Candidatus Electryonea clarkiae]MDP8286842.1 carboxypeptidase regulatory-like domain-containing protein [Candidatus Electryonea clarkiae]
MFGKSRSLLPKLVLSGLLLAGFGLVGCDSGDSDDSPTGPGNNNLPGETFGDIAITVEDNEGTPIYSWAGSDVVDLQVVRTTDTTRIVWGIASDSTSSIASPVTHGTVPSGSRNYASGNPEEELELEAEVQYEVEVTRSDGTWGSKQFVPTGADTSSTNPVDSSSFIEGWVLEMETDLAIVGAIVTSDEGITTYSVEEGYYLISATPGKRLITVTAEGYKTNIEDLNPEAGDTMVWYFAMEPGEGGDSFGAIQGIVTDSESGAPVRGVRLLHESGLDIYTLGDGAYFSAFVSGLNTINASHDDYADHNFQVNVIAGEIFTTNFTMSSDSGGGEDLGHIMIACTDGEFEALGGVLVESDDGYFGTTNDVGGLDLDVSAGTRYFEASKDGYETQYDTVEVEADEYYHVSFVMTAGGGGGTGTIEGYVTNSQNGEPLEGVSILSDDGESTTTSEDGSYLIAVDAGIRTITAILDGYYSNARTLSVADDDEVENFNFTLVASGDASGEMRFVLQWGETPRDLDSHILTPEIEDTEYHIYYGSRGDSADVPYAKLDHDDVSSFGPETITIYRFFTDENDTQYRYYIHNYSGSPDFTNSGAYVEIWTGEGRISTISVPTQGSGTYWYICDIDGSDGSIEVVNEILEDEPDITNAIHANPKF